MPYFADLDKDTVTNAGFLLQKCFDFFVLHAVLDTIAHAQC